MNTLAPGSDTLITQIGRIPQILVLSAGSMEKHAETATHNAVTAGRELHVEAVVAGTLQREADVLHVTARLLRVEDGIVLWSGKFDEKFTNVFAIEDAISQSVAKALIPNLSGQDRK